ncbi:hypothetical protein LTR62_003599 [Meristemomyces frigidus]|uniref:Uncharacterized protein n=1 Tax=Meristemomyces frigidus TaxID=1508187 RepID=A0AAN7TG41_9PEZI|nr:hypothetical protein LTR62_003599 [Meristemomyces frigidus]
MVQHPMGDFHLSFDRGAEPSMLTDTYDRPLPSNCNDTDFDEQSTLAPNHPDRNTDRSIALIDFEGSALSLRIDQTHMDWQDRMSTVRSFQKRLKGTVQPRCPPGHPMHLIIKDMITAIFSGMMLRAIRPFHYSGHTAPPTVSSPWVMQVALDQLCFAASRWSTHIDGWRTPPWIPGHPIAVVLAGLCSVRDTLLPEEAWKLVVEALERYGEDVADSNDGTLWRPIAKFYKRAVAYREASALRAQALASVDAPAQMSAGAQSFVHSYGPDTWSLDLSALPSLDLDLDLLASVPEISVVDDS